MNDHRHPHDSSCPTADEVARVVEAGPSDPRWAHVSECPRCAAHARLYRAFRDGEPAIGAGGGTDEADRRIRDAVEAAMRRAQPRRAAAADRVARPLDDGAAFEDPLGEPARTKRRGRWRTGAGRARAWGVAWRPALAAAAVALVAWGAWWWSGGGPEPALQGRMRGADATAPALRIEQLEPAGEGESAAVRLSWTPVAGADEYVVEAFDSTFARRVRVSAGRRTSATVPRSRLGAPAADGTWWRVVALRAGSEIARSAPRRLETAPVGEGRSPAR